jgi:hypothetical protein
VKKEYSNLVEYTGLLLAGIGEVGYRDCGVWSILTLPVVPDLQVLFRETPCANEWIHTYNLSKLPRFHLLPTPNLPILVPERILGHCGGMLHMDHRNDQCLGILSWGHQYYRLVMHIHGRPERV